MSILDRPTLAPAGRDGLYVLCCVRRLDPCIYWATGDRAIWSRDRASAVSNGSTGLESDTITSQVTAPQWQARQQGRALKHHECFPRPAC